MNRYILQLSKNGYMKYISHLDMMRLFKSAFKRANIRLVYSQGFNPHPKMGFAQPLSLGYASRCEILEFDAIESFDPEEIKARMNPLLPEGIQINAGYEIPSNGKRFAATARSASYQIIIPVKDKALPAPEKLCEAFLSQSQILASKKVKRTGGIEELNIKEKIRKLSAEMVDNNLILHTKVDCGSTSNLSPELLIRAFLDFAALKTERDEIEVERVEMEFH